MSGLCDFRQDGSWSPCELEGGSGFTSQNTWCTSHSISFLNFKTKYLFIPNMKDDLMFKVLDWTDRAVLFPEPLSTPLPPFFRRRSLDNLRAGRCQCRCGTTAPGFLSSPETEPCFNVSVIQDYKHISRKKGAEVETRLCSLLLNLSPLTLTLCVEISRITLHLLKHAHRCSLINFLIFQPHMSNCGKEHKNVLEGRKESRKTHTNLFSTQQRKRKKERLQAKRRKKENMNKKDRYKRYNLRWLL